MQMFITTLYETAKNWKVIIYSSIDEWIKKLYYIYTMEYKLSNKKNELWHAATWVNLKIVLLTEKSQRKRGYTVWFHLYKCLENAKYSDRK